MVMVAIGRPMKELLVWCVDMDSILGHTVSRGFEQPEGVRKTPPYKSSRRTPAIFATAMAFYVA